MEFQLASHGKGFLMSIRNSIIVVFVFSMIISSTARSAAVLPVAMDDLVKKTNVAFAGKCIDAVPETVYAGDAKSKIPVAVYTFEIKQEDVLKGNVPEMFTFKQWGVSADSASKLRLPNPIGVPTYKVGLRYTLFLTAKTKLGLRAPIGLGRGAFRMFSGNDGKIKIMNSYGNRGLFDGKTSPRLKKALSVQGANASKMHGPMDYDALKNMVKALK